MELTISIPENVGHILQQRAKAEGRDVKEFVEGLVEEQVLSPSLDELLAPIRQAVTESGTTEEELDEFMYSLRRKVKEEAQHQP